MLTGHQAVIRRPDHLVPAQGWRAEDNYRKPSPHCFNAATLFHYPEKATPMTQKEFRHKVRLRERARAGTDHLGYIFLVVIGLVLLHPVLQHPSSQNVRAGAWLGGLITLLLLSAGTSGLWQLAKGYKVRQVDTRKSWAEKLSAVESYLCQVDLVYRQMEGNWIMAAYHSTLLTRIVVWFYLDVDKVLFTACAADLFGGGTLVDYGVRRRAMNRMETCLVACLQQPS